LNTTGPGERHDWTATTILALLQLLNLAALAPIFSRAAGIERPTRFMPKWAFLSVFAVLIVANGLILLPRGRWQLMLRRAELYDHLSGGYGVSFTLLYVLGTFALFFLAVPAA
jgi:hypothetical protein